MISVVHTSTRGVRLRGEAMTNENASLLNPVRSSRSRIPWNRKSPQRPRVTFKPGKLPTWSKIGYEELRGEDDGQKTADPFPWRIWITAVFICSGGSLHHGFQLTMINPSERVFEKFTNSTILQHYGYVMDDDQYRSIWSIVLNLLVIGATLGTIPIVKLSETLGRRRSFYVSSAFTLAGLVLQFLSKQSCSIELFAFGRFVTGIGGGLALALEPMYLTEISPIARRGLIGSMTGIFVELGFILGSVAALPTLLGTDDRWPWMPFVEIIPIVFLLIMIPFIHESPRYLLARGKLDECRRSLLFFGHRDIDVRIEEIRVDIHSQTTRTTLGEIFRKKHLRRATFLGTLVALTSVHSGIIALDFFSTSILIDVGMSRTAAQYATVGIFVQCLISAIVGSLIVDRVGRRCLLLSTTLILILTHAALMLFSILYEYYRITWAGSMSVLSCVLFSLTFGMGPSVLQWTTASEMVPQNARSTVQLVTMTVQKLAGISVGLAFYPLQGAIGAYAFLMFTIPLIVFFCIFVKAFPETKQRSVVEVMKELGYKEPSEESGEVPLSGFSMDMKLDAK